MTSKEYKPLLTFVSCGSVDDGKSTLIGKLLYESKLIYQDQLNALAKDSRKYGTTGDDIDVALLVDGLTAEREQGITIDVAYRFFSTPKRKFVVIDAPGHEQYTKNMATGASHADFAVVLVDARKGVLAQTRRHTYLLSLLSIKHIIFVVNKMDLVNYDEAIFNRHVEAYQHFTAALKFSDVYAIPISARQGDNVIEPSVHMPWYQGPSFLSLLEDINLSNSDTQEVFRMAIQWVNRPNSEFRGFTGRVNAGQVKPGDKVIVLPSMQQVTIKQLLSFDGELAAASKGQSITCVFDEDVDVSRGDVLADINSPCQVTEQFQAMLLWMADKPLVAGRQYLLKQGTCEALCTPSKPKYQVDINSLKHVATKQLKRNEMGCCDFALDRAITLEPYQVNKNLGSFILIDRQSNETVAAGMIEFSLRRSTNVSRQPLLVQQASRSAIKPHKPAVVWLTGLSGSGKSTIANLVELELNQMGVHTILLDGDNIRHGLTRDLGFTEADRAENIRRIAEVSKLMTEAGLITLVAFISPYASERDMAKHIVGEDKFFEIYVSTPLEVAEARDHKGLYQKARAGEIENFTGINSPYEAPKSPALRLNSSEIKPEQLAMEVLQLLKHQQIIS